jgi:hypothetical protein
MLDNIQTLWGREPAMVVALVDAVLTLLIAFGLAIAPEQKVAIIGVVTIALGLLTRSQVTPA